jgi:RNA-binding protein YlmH
MTSEEKQSIARYAKLSQRALDKGIYTETPFLTEGEQALLKKEKLPLPPRFEGGFDGAERCLAVFGSAEELGWEWESPIVILKIEPKSRKFAEELTHRDYLGAVLNLGIKREMLGDLVLSRGDAYLFVMDSIAPYLAENLNRVRHTDVVIREVSGLPDGVGIEFSEKTVIASSPRVDALVAAVFDLSRSEGKALVEKERVSLSGLSVTDPAKEIPAGEKISVRGYGKFIFDGAVGETRSGRSRMKVRLFV